MAMRFLSCSNLVLLVACLLASPAIGRAASAYDLKSPSGNLLVSFELKSLPNLAGERAAYRISYRGQPVLVDSPLGLDLLKQPALDRDFEVTGTQHDSNDSTWENRFGSRLVVRDHYNQMTVSLRERQSPQRRVDLIFRAYDEGIAFRYFLPQQEALKDFTLSSENTGFYFARDTRALALDIRSYTGPYEARYSEIGLDQIKPASIVPLPLLMRITGGPWVALLEADLTDYAGMYVGGASGIPSALVSRLSPLPGRSDEAVVASTPKATPWRVLMVNEQPGGLIESNDLILNLNPPCAIADTSWIEPGKVTFPWWSGFWGGDGAFEHNVNTAMFKHYIDFAARSGIRYIEISDWWYKSPPEVELPENYPEGKVDITQPNDKVDVTHLIDYARQKGVKCILWMDWAAMNRQMDAAIPLYEKWGAAGMKIDFMNRDDQKMVNFYRRVTELAAKHHLVINFHGAFKPTGLRRTYPNVLNREGVMGMEYDKVYDWITPGHDVTLPFTRMLAGPMDFTPGAFRNSARGQFKPQFNQPMSQGTRAHQLAMYVVYEMPLAMVSDYPEAYDGQPDFEFIRKVRSAWDDTKVLNGEPGQFITIARRKGREWYLGSMTNGDARDFKLDLGFLGEGRFEAQIFADGPDADRVATQVAIRRKSATRQDQLEIHLAPGGGAAMIFTPAP